MKTIKATDLRKEISATLEDFAGATQDVLERAVDVTAKDLVKDLKTTSPKDTGEYAKSWTQKKTTSSKGLRYGRVAYVKSPNYRLTHLLEYGHALLNGGRVKPQPHIAPASEKAAKQFEQRIVEGINKIKVQ